MNDEEIWQDYPPGFSYAVVCRAIREVRRTSTFVPSHFEVIEKCQRHRQKFRQWQGDAAFLLNRRDEAEDILLGLGEIKLSPADDDDEAIPF